MVNNIPIIKNVDYDVWNYELTHYVTILYAVSQDNTLDPYMKQKIAEEALKDVKRFIWYCIGETYPC
jgi:hypothetical protein